MCVEEPGGVGSSEGYWITFSSAGGKGAGITKTQTKTGTRVSSMHCYFKSVDIFFQAPIPIFNFLQFRLYDLKIIQITLCSSFLSLQLKL